MSGNMRFLNARQINGKLDKSDRNILEMSCQQFGITKDILIVDDTPENLRPISTMLISQGYNVRKALSGQMALRAVQTVVPDLILLDIMMPSMNGYEVCERLKADPKTAEITVIFLSALSEAFDKVTAFGVGGSDYITKPFQADYALTMSVNLSARQFTQPDLFEQIDQVLAETQLSPQCLKLEITESVIMENANSAAAILQKLRERQIKLSMDDFGTGYSSLSYLHSFPVDSLKIDRSFVQRLDGLPESLGLVPAIMSIAWALGMNAIALRD